MDGAGPERVDPDERDTGVTEVTPEGLSALVGQQLGPSAWLEVDQARVDAFAAITGDEQWIHTDPVRAAASPYATTIAHGHLTLSLVPVLMRGAWRVIGAKALVNYGLDRVRFPAPVSVPSRLRASATVAEVTTNGEGILTVALDVTVEREGSERPVCVARTLTRIVPHEPEEDTP